MRPSVIKALYLIGEPDEPWATYHQRAQRYITGAVDEHERAAAQETSAVLARDALSSETMHTGAANDMKAVARDTASAQPFVVEAIVVKPATAIWRRFILAWVENLPPSMFSLVMATGIISIASNLLGMPWIARCLFLMSVVFYGLLWTMTGARLLCYPNRMLEDLRQSAVSPGYFTIVAATSVVGSEFVIIAGNLSVALWLWMFAVALWLLITYAVFTSIIVLPRKSSKRQGLNGFWLIAAVATQSVSVLTTAIVPVFEAQEAILFLSLFFYLMGCMLYIKIIVLIFHRLTFIPLTPVEMTPPYWISMGATAITTQAGAALMLRNGQSQFLTDLAPFIKGFTLFFWAAGTWWIPLLVALGVWVHLVRRVPLNYTPQFWGVVFPIGMYTASTFQLAAATGLNFLFLIPKASIYLALLAWTLALAGMVRQFGKEAGPREHGTPMQDVGRHIGETGRSGP
jgi:tellurite resistance protein TehA-like permease